MQKKLIALLVAATLCMSACSTKNNVKDKTQEARDNTIKNTYTCDESEAHAIETDGKEETYQNILVNKTGDSEGDESDFYGSNAAVFASNGATLTILNSEIKTDGVHANGVFSYGEGTAINVVDSEIKTEKATSGGVMVTGGGTLNATNLTVTTQSGSSAPIRSDRGGGNLNVKGGTYKSYGSGSPAIYSTAKINVEDASLYADVSEAVVVEGKNSVTITNSDVTGKNTTHNSDKADIYRNVMIYQSMSGDSQEGKGEFTMTGGNLSSKNGTMFFVTNTVADINLENVNLQSSSDDLLKIEKAGWGNDGENGGQVTFTANNQSLEGGITVDEISVLNMYLKGASAFTGNISSSGMTYVEIDNNSTWILNADSEISALTCDENAIKLNGHTLKVNGKVYKEGTKSSGEAIEIKAPTSSGVKEMPPGEETTMPFEEFKGENDGNQPPQKPQGTQPEKPDGNGAPPDKPKDRKE